MQTSVSRTAKLIIPADVQAFAEERGLAPYLPKVVEILHRVFAEATQLAVEVHDDPEIADLRWIVFDVDVPWSKQQWREGMKAWHRETRAVCPAPLMPTFCLIAHRTL
jgi:hypothetical protein